MKHLAILVCALSVTVAAARPGLTQDLIPDDVIASMQSADVVILGEVHDNPRHHQVQTEGIEAVKPSAVVWEMVTEEGAQRLAQTAASDPEELGRILQWAETGWPPLSMYYPVFEASDAPVYGAMVPRTAARAAMKRGAATALGADAARFGLTVPLSQDDQTAREADQFAAHCNAIPAEALPQLVAIQRLRDAVLARAVLRAMEETGGPVAVITGNGHARKDRGIPTFLSRLQPGLKVYVLGQSEDGIVDGAFDAVIDSPSVDREDPCKAFETQN
ncbi:ChaN family lipoprotein [Rhodobacteraceae bacterium B1Z28]|uniref:ChaN family lipoprotein n=1 Tax=Ruegeria haliotis TaxID=2747601 RepID=A0ABX2PQV1_9RHOB|nr:ChaN family lipoprotein [Ruegeria haliotis]NVO56502.1 ChaN family lipoprotein [Ruegeria haliotis]